MNIMRDKLQRKIDQYKIRSMSNAKWRKFFSLAEESTFRIIRSNWKYIGDDQVFKKYGLPAGANLLEERLSDGLWLPVYYKHIEFISIPRYCQNLRQDPKRPLPDIEQPIAELMAYLQSRACFPLTLSPTELRLRAYEI